MKKILVVIDMQNDFVTDALRNEDAIKIVPNVVKRVKKAVKNDEYILFTKDIHASNYMDTIEGKKLPVPHCIEGTKGCDIIPELAPYTKDRLVVGKNTFGSAALAQYIAVNRPDSVEFIGVCTDICVISNVLITKAFIPNTPIYVNELCCAGVTKESHDNAIKAMEACHIEIRKEI